MSIFYFLCTICLFQKGRAHLPVQQPVFKSLPMTIKSEENDTVFLPCVVSDLGESTIRWWRDETLLSDSKRPLMGTPPRVTVTRDGMKIDFLESEDKGEYTCEVVRPKPWSSLKLIHKLQVLYPPKIMRLPSNGYLEARLGENIMMGCSAIGMPPPQITWRLEKSFLKLEEMTEIVEFTATSRHMSGIYQCEADNGIGDPVHANIVLRILYPPEVTVEKSWIHSAPGVKSSLLCHVVADPEARMEWLFNGDRLNISAPRMTYRTRGNDHILLLTSTRASDFGNYSCVASNRLGSSQGYMQLSGIANPVIIKKVEEVTPEDFSLIWEVDSYSPIIEYKVHFRKRDSEWVSFIIPADGSLSGPLHSKSYTFSGLDKFSVYEARIFSRNRFGWSNSSEIVTFGFVESKYTEEQEETNDILSVAYSSRGSQPVSVPTSLLAILLIKFFQRIYDTF